MEKELNVSIKVNNVPDYVIGHGYMVVINDSGELWFYGFYDTETAARGAVEENDTRFMVEIG